MRLIAKSTRFTKNPQQMGTLTKGPRRARQRPIKASSNRSLFDELQSISLKPWHPKSSCEYQNLIARRAREVVEPTLGAVDKFRDKADIATSEVRAQVHPSICRRNHTANVCKLEFLSAQRLSLDNHLRPVGSRAWCFP